MRKEPFPQSTEEGYSPVSLTPQPDGRRQSPGVRLVDLEHLT